MKQPAIVTVALGVITGVAAGSYPLGPIVIGIGLLVIPGKQWLFVAGLAIGTARIIGSPITTEPPALASPLTGMIASYPETDGARQRAVLEVGGPSGPDRVLFYGPPHPELRPGDRISADGRVSPAPELPGFDYPRYLAKDGIHGVFFANAVVVQGSQWTIQRALFPTRDWFLRSLQYRYDEPAASFLGAILIGDRSGVPPELVGAFQRTGTIHVMALSGFNISLIVVALIALAGRTPAAIAAASLGVGAFVLLVGATASVVRAAVMAGFLLWAQVAGRPQEALLACLVTGAGMLLWNPWALRYDLGFDLSFLATIGILVLEPSLRKQLTWLPRRLRPVVAATLAAGIATAPLIASSFSSVSLIAPVANLAVVPVIPFLMAGGALSAVLPLAALSVPVQIVADLTLGLVERLSHVPLASVDVATYRFPATLVLALMAAWLTVRLRRAHV